GPCGSPGRGGRAHARAEAGAEAASLGAAGLPRPGWLRGPRLAGLAAASASADGRAWETVGTAGLDLGADALLGLPVAATDYEGDGLSARARFTDVRPTGVFDPDPPAPAAPPDGPPFAIERVYPNPFNPATTVRLAVDRPGLYRIEVYDVLGRRVREWALRPEA